MENQNEADASKLKEIKELVDHVYNLKLISDKAEKEYNSAKNRLAEIMEKAEIDKMAGDECNASLTLKTSVSFPKEEDGKVAIAEYIASQDNPELEPKRIEEAVNNLFHLSPTLLKMFTINARSFSSWATAEIERKASEGEFEFQLPAVKPYEYYSVGLRKRSDRKKGKK